jgi:hypothetical protein
MNEEAFGTNLKESEIFFENVKPRFLLANPKYSLEDFLRWLYAQQLIKQENQKNSITAKGKAFLIYVVDPGLDISFYQF